MSPDDFLGNLKRFRWPLLGGAAALAAYSAYSSSKAKQEAALAAAAAAPPAVAGAVPGSEAALIQQGAGIAVGAQQPILGLGQAGFDLAGTALGVAGGVAEAASGSLTSAALGFGSLTGDILGAVLAQPPAPTQQTQTPTQQPPAPAVAEIRYFRRATPGRTYKLYAVNSSGKLTSERNNLVTDPGVRVSRHVSGGQLYWTQNRTSYSWVPGATTPTDWYVEKRYYDSTGKLLKTDNIGKTGR